MFEDFWRACPKKVGKPAARKAWDKAIKKADPELIIRKVELYAKWLSEAKPGEFRPIPKHPQGWLNDERWNDEELRDPVRRPVSSGWRGEVVR